MCGRQPQGDTPWADTPRTDIPLGRHPTGQTPPWPDTPLRSACWDTLIRLPSACLDTSPAPGSHCSGRYASYWNAFLFVVKFTSADMCCLSRNNLQFIGVCIMICVNASHHWAIMTSGVFILVDLHTMFIVLLLIMATYVIFHNMS